MHVPDLKSTPTVVVIIIIISSTKLNNYNFKQNQKLKSTGS